MASEFRHRHLEMLTHPRGDTIQVQCEIRDADTGETLSLVVAPCGPFENLDEMKQRVCDEATASAMATHGLQQRLPAS